MKKSRPRRPSKKKDIRGLSLPPSRAVVRSLENGLDVIVQQEASNPLVSAQVWVRAGSIHEGPWTGAGLAHLVEHMLFKGTDQRSPQQITQFIQERGGYVNAYTSFNRTVYWIDGLAAHTDGYLEALADMVRNSKFDEAELSREMDVIRREMAMDNDDPSSLLQHSLQAAAFRRHPMRHPVIGHREVFDQVRREDVLRFVRRHYVPNNCFIVITGDIDPEDALAMVKKHFGGWQRKAGEPLVLPDEPLQHGSRSTVRAFPAELARIAFGWVIPGEASDEKAALDVLAFLLGSGRSSRLFHELREKRGLAHSVWAGAWAVAECGLFTVEADCDPPDVAATERSALDVIERIRQDGPAASELDKAVRSTLAGQLRALTTTRGQAASLGHGWLTVGSLEYGELYLKAVERLTPSMIRDAAVRHLDPHRMSQVIVEPERIRQTGSAKPEAVRRGRTECVVLPNGLTLIVGENKRLPLVSMRAQFLAGVPLETDADAGVTQVAAQMLMKGTRRRSAEELAVVLESRGGHIISQGDAHRFILGTEVVSGDESLGLDIIADLATGALLPADQLPQVRKRQLAAIREELEDPLTVALRQARKRIFAGSPFARTALGAEESVQRLSIADCRGMISRSLCGANGVLSIFGDIDAKEIIAEAGKVFGKLPRGERASPASAVAPAKLSPGEWEHRMSKEQAVIVIGFRTAGLLDSVTPALMLIDEACSDMGSRLFQRIREELGLAYYVGAQAFSVMGTGAFYFYAGTDPKKAGRAQREMRGQIADLAARGLRPDELERAKTTWRSNWLRSQQGNTSHADGTGWDEINGHGWQHYERLPSVVEAVTEKEVRLAAARFFDPKKAFIVRVMSE